MHHSRNGVIVGKRHGFTLIELLVVVSIIALLVSILLPALSKARRQAKVVVCLSNQHSIYVAVVLYANDYRDFLPGNYDGPDFAGWQTLDRYYIQCNGLRNHGFLFPYIGDNPEVLWCPAGHRWPYESWRTYRDDPAYSQYSTYSLRALTSSDYQRLSGRKSVHSAMLADTCTEVNYMDMPGATGAYRYDTVGLAFAAWHWDVYNTLYYAGHAVSLRYSDEMLLYGIYGFPWQYDNTSFWDYAEGK